MLKENKLKHKKIEVKQMADENLNSTKSTTEGQENVETPFKAFATEEEYNTALKKRKK